MPRLARSAAADRGIFAHEPVCVPEDDLAARSLGGFRCPRGQERRPEPELAQLLNEQLKDLRAGQLLPVDQWLHQMQQHRT